MAPPDSDSHSCAALFLPDFCAVRMVFAVAVIAQLLAFVIALVAAGRQGINWQDLGLISLFVQWVALTSAAVLCAGRRWLCRLSNRAAGTLSYLLLLGVTALVSEAAYWLGRYIGMPGDWHANFLLQNIAVSAIVSAVTLRYFYIQHQWKRNLESEAEARIQALQARIRPHFLFNSMNTIASLTRAQPALAEAAVEDLSDLFRATLADARKRVPLEAEFELARRYLRIEKLRLGERLNVEWDTAELPLDALIPALSVQPLLENAIYHGIEACPEGGTIRIAGCCRRGAVELTISNPVAGEVRAARHRGNRMAQDNVRERLAAHYGGKGELRVDADEGEYRVSLRFPYQSGAEEDAILT